jgi:hypothetical protein
MNITVDRTAKAYAKGEVQISAPAEKVYKTILDINNWAAWQSDVKYRCNKW